jgi:hypothetical protein
MSPDTRPKTIEVTRAEFYNQVWSIPMSKLAKKYGLSDVALAKKCKKHNIPRPSRGWWAQKQAGYRVRQIPLPKGDDITIVITPSTENTIFRDKARKDCRLKRIAKIPVPAQITNPHPLITQSAPLQSAKLDDNQRLLPDERCLDIRVSPANLTRAFLIMDTLIKALTSMGYAVSVSEGQTKVQIDKTFITIGLSEELARRRLRAKNHDLQGHYDFGYRLYAKTPTPSGGFCLSIKDAPKDPWPAYRTNWRDTESQKLEECLNSFIYGLVKVATIRKQQEEQKESS